MTKQRITLLVVTVMALIVAASLLYRRAVPPPAKDLLGLGVVGDVAAEETVQLIGNRGRIAIICFEARGGTRGGTGNVSIRQGIERRLQQESNIQLVATERIPVPSKSASQQAVQLILKHRNLDAVILIGGLLNVSATDVTQDPPSGIPTQGLLASEPMNREDFLNLPRPLPRIVSVLTFDAAGSKQLLEAGILAVAIENPYYPVQTPHAIRNERDLFNSLYVVVTTNNLEALGLNPLRENVTADSEL